MDFLDCIVLTLSIILSIFSPRTLNAEESFPVFLFLISLTILISSVLMDFLDESFLISAFNSLIKALQSLLNFLLASAI